MDYIEEQLTIRELLDIFQSGKYDIEIDSIDGFVQVEDVFETEVKRKFITQTDGYSVSSSMDHKIDTPTGMVSLKNLSVGDEILTRSGSEIIKEIESSGKEQMYDVSVVHGNHRYYANGISVSNCGLALLYGGSAYSLMRNMDCTQDLAQSRIDSFFSKLTTLNQYMINIKRKVLKTGQVYNLFGRRRDMSKWAFSKAASFKQRRQDQAYAERTGLNHPIQSTAAEVLKIEMVRVDEYIEKNNLDPLYGMAPPRHIDFDKISYKDFKLSMLASIHDELDYYFREDQFDILIPEVYKVMQIKDVVKGFGVDFDLELDVEYDETRSFTSTKVYPASKIYLLMKLSSKNFSEETESNTIMLKFEDINDSVLSQLNNFNKDTVSGDQKVYTLGVEKEDNIYFHNIKFPEEIFEQFNITYRKIFVEGF